MPKPEQCSGCTKPATIHLTQIVDSKIHKVDLCEQCPHKSGVTDPQGFSLADFLLKPPAVIAAAKEILSCEQCGFTPADFKKTGRFGCSGCYASFASMLKPMLANMHRDIVHRGKVPARSVNRAQLERQLEDLQKHLSQAVQQEAYEEAARLRDTLSQVREQLEALPAPTSHGD